ncbi:MAG: tetratricopeptide repeat protein [Chloroflexi bacterium]|nr:tetratricopeptide repeat protein [Chloroflexota bacterium]
MTEASNPVVKMITEVRSKIRQDIYKGTLNYDSATSTLNRYLDVARKMDNRVLVGQIYETLGTIEVERGSYKEGYKLYEQSLEAFKSINDMGRVSAMLNNLGEVHSRIGNHDEAAKYYREARKLAEQTARLATIISSYNNEGRVCIATGKYDEAIELLNRGLQINMDSGKWDFNIVRSTIPEIHSNLAMAYCMKGEYDVAWHNAQRALEIASEFTQLDQVALAYQALAIIAARDDSRKEKAPEYFAQSRENWTKIEAVVSLGRLYAMEGDYWAGISNVDNARKSYAGAISCLDKAQLVKEADVVRQKLKSI